MNTMYYIDTSDTDLDLPTKGISERATVGIERGLETGAPGKGGEFNVKRGLIWPRTYGKFPKWGNEGIFVS